MRAFKHTPAEFAEDFLSGKSIKLGTLSYYRQGEGRRVDNLEGNTVTTSSPIFGPVRPDDPEMAHKLRRLRLAGLYIDPNVKIENVNIRDNFVIRSYDDVLVFCASRKPDFSLNQEVFQISKFARFAQELTTAIPFKVRNPQVGLVFYRNRVADVQNEDPLAPSPFFKGIGFAWEMEVRAVWHFEHQEKPPRDGYVLINCPGASKYIKSVRASE